MLGLHGGYLPTLLISLALASQALAASNATAGNEVAALRAFKARMTTLGPLSSWVDGTDPCGTPDCGGSMQPTCSWPGVACLGWRVVGLRLNVRNTGQSFAGSLGDELSVISQLSVIDFAGNKLSGALPASYGNLTQLQIMDLSANDFASTLPPQWGKLSMLGILALASNQLYSTLPVEWSGMQQLRSLDLRENCGICGGLPNFPQHNSPDFTVLARDTSLGWTCGSGNCSTFPLGFVGQAAIILAVAILMISCCCWRRFHLFRRHSQVEEERSGMGLVLSVLSMRRAPQPPRGGNQRVEEGEEGGGGEGPPRKVEPPIVVVMPDGSSLCTARLDPEVPSLPEDALAAALAAAGGDSPKGEGGGGSGAQQAAGGSGPQAERQTGGQAGRRWGRWFRWLRRRDASGSSGGGTTAAASSSSQLQRAQAGGGSGSGGSSWVEIYSHSSAVRAPQGNGTLLLRPAAQARRSDDRSAGGTADGGGPAEIVVLNMEGAWGLGTVAAGSTSSSSSSGVQPGQGPSRSGAAGPPGERTSGARDGADGLLPWGSFELAHTAAPASGGSVRSGRGSGSVSRSRRQPPRQVPVYNVDLSDLSGSAEQGGGGGSSSGRHGGSS